MTGARMTDRRTLLLGSAALGASGMMPGAAAAFARDPVVPTSNGPVRGRRAGGIAVFKGLRYGQDTRTARFQAPRAPQRWRDPADAFDFAPSCPQRGDRYARTSEDCLFLNVWTPGTDTARRPVMVYFHGGAYSTGSVDEQWNDGAKLAAREDVVVVTVNHRLNAFGYLYLARLDPRFADSGNAGQLDLIRALQWVRDNIAGFGGDPERVMVFGQSGGGAKIATLMGTPAAEGLFQRAATMSGQQVTASGPLNASARAGAYLDALGVSPDNLGPLLTMPTEALVEGLTATDPVLGGTVYFGPVLDMKWLTRHPFWPDANPQSRSIPMILGNTHDETRGFLAPGSAKVAGLNWDNIAARMAPELRIDILPEWVVAQYRARFPTYGPEEVFWAATTAGRSWRGQVIEADERAKAGAEATWVYQVDFPSPVDPMRRAPHTHDIPLVFGTLDADSAITGTGPAAQALSARMMAGFAALARTGSPQAPALPHWANYTLPDRATMVFDAETRLVNDPRQWERELFARVPYIQPGT